MPKARGKKIGNTPTKFRIGTRKTGKPAHGMSTATLQEVLEGANTRPRDKAKIKAVLAKRGVEVS